MSVKYTPSECPKCGAELAKSPRGGRPTRWCSDGCKRSGEAELARLQSKLRDWEDGLRECRLNGYDTNAYHKESFERRVAIIAEMQARFDHLAGVPVREDCK
jgi:hypothetical protein